MVLLAHLLSLVERKYIRFELINDVTHCVWQTRWGNLASLAAGLLCWRSTSTRNPHRNTPFTCMRSEFRSCIAFWVWAATRAVVAARQKSSAIPNIMQMNPSITSISWGKYPIAEQYAGEVHHDIKQHCIFQYSFHSPPQVQQRYNNNPPLSMVDYNDWPSSKQIYRHDFPLCNFQNRGGKYFGCLFTSCSCTSFPPIIKGNGYQSIYGEGSAAIEYCVVEFTLCASGSPAYRLCCIKFSSCFSYREQSLTSNDRAMDSFTSYFSVYQL